MRPTYSVGSAQARIRLRGIHLTRDIGSPGTAETSMQGSRGFGTNIQTYPVPILRLTTGDPALSGPDYDRRLIVAFQWPSSVCRSDLAMRRCDHLAPRRIGPIRGCAGSRDASFCLAWTLGAKLSHWWKFDVRKCCGLKQLDVR